MWIFLYGPPASGKSSLGRRLAERLAQPFYDLDQQIVSLAARPIPQIFAQDGEPGFRQIERQALLQVLDDAPGVVALGGGALLNDQNRRQVEAAGVVLSLQAPFETLAQRLAETDEARPLLNGGQEIAAAHDPQRLQALLDRRGEHYASFPLTLNADQPLDELLAQAQIALGAYRVSGMGQPYPVRVRPGGLAQVGQELRSAGLQPGTAALVSDEHVAPLYAERVMESLRIAEFSPQLIVIPAGEAHKTLATVERLWAGFLDAGIERGSPVLALGGGVVGDLAGFAASAFLRGVPWAVLPTSLLSMVDASLGGKTGADLPQGKNLIGAFHPPRLVLADPDVLSTLPEAELRSGLAEVVKHGVISDPQLFALCAAGWEAVLADLDALVRRAMAVKVAVIVEDPYERGRRAALNLGHTIGHAVELVSAFRLRHGEAVAIGMVLEARLAERLGLAEPGLASEIAGVLTGLGLPTTIPPDLDRAAIRSAMTFDKKRKGGAVRFALPETIGSVRVGVDAGQAVMEVVK